jgi:error-prone DNA polymerase
MTEPFYAELHASSAFSFLSAASQPEHLVETAATLGLPAIALLDRNGVYGAVRMHTRARSIAEAGGPKVRAHYGAEMNLSLLLGNDSATAALPVLCINRAGYANLCRLLTRIKLRAPGKEEGIATLDDLAGHAEGLLCLTGGEDGPLHTALRQGGELEGRKVLERLLSVFSRDRLYVELQRHYEREEEWRNQAAIRLARSMQLPIVSTNGVPGESCRGGNHPSLWKQHAARQGPFAGRQGTPPDREAWV